jgi:hypothetical protein
VPATEQRKRRSLSSHSGDRDHRESGNPALAEIDCVAQLADALAGVRCTTADKMAESRYHERAVRTPAGDLHLASGLVV